MNRTAPFFALLAMLISLASARPTIAVGAPGSAPVNAGHGARPWKLSCANGISGAFASAADQASGAAIGITSTGMKTGSARPSSIELTNGTVNSSFAAWTQSFGGATKRRVQRCTLDFRSGPQGSLRYTLIGAWPSKLVNGRKGHISELVLAFNGVSMQTHK